MPSRSLLLDIVHSFLSNAEIYQYILRKRDVFTLYQATIKLLNYFHTRSSQLLHKKLILVTKMLPRIIVLSWQDACYRIASSTRARLQDLGVIDDILPPTGLDISFVSINKETRLEYIKLILVLLCGFRLQVNPI